MKPAALDPQTCPLCGQANQCAVAADLPPQSCWCMNSHIPSQVLEQIPAEQRGKACVCPQCGQSPATDSASS